MRGVLLILAASLAASLPAAPATAQSGAGASFSHHRASTHHGGAFGRFGRSPGVRVHRGHGDAIRFGDVGSFDRRRDRDRRGDVFFPYRDYQGDTLWRPDSFNDWWHDRPERAFPRWVGANRKCERLWWSGGGWRC